MRPTMRADNNHGAPGVHNTSESCYPKRMTSGFNIAGAQPSPIEIAIEPKSKADQEKLGIALAKLAAEDPLFSVSTDQESGQTILKGTDERHLDIKVDILQRTYKV